VLKCLASALELHPERAAMIKEVEGMPGVMWKAMAHPRFAAQAPGASKSLCGVKGDPKVAVEAAVANGEITRIVADLNAVIPESFDSEQNWPSCAKIIGDIRDQSNCGCCWAFAGAEAASDRMCIATNASLMLPLSAQDVCFNANPDGCDGGQIDTPWSFIRQKGAVTGGQYHGSGPFGAGLCSSFSLPHCHHHGPQGDDPYPAEGKPGCPHESSPSGPRKCDVGAKTPHDNFADDKYTYKGQTITASGEKGIQQAIMAGGPVETAFTVYSDFENYASGIYHHVSGGMAGGHAVKLVGWGVENGQKYWKVANSWNPWWGEKGYFRIRRGNNEGGIEDQIVASSPAAKWGKNSQLAVRRYSRGYVRQQPLNEKIEVAVVTDEDRNAAPSAIDWSQRGATSPVKDQGKCGSCWAFSTTEGIESAVFMSTGKMPVLSTQQIISCDKEDNGCDGGDLPNALKYVEQAGGIDTGSDYPDESHISGKGGKCSWDKKEVAKVTSFKYAVPPCNEGACNKQDEETLAAALAKFGPISICLNANDWDDYNSGVYKKTCSSKASAMDHCVQLVGYDKTAPTPYWKVRNSWNTNWGEEGFIRLQMGVNACGLANEPVIINATVSASRATLVI